MGLYIPLWLLVPVVLMCYSVVAMLWGALAFNIADDDRLTVACGVWGAAWPLTVPLGVCVVAAGALFRLLGGR